MALTRIGRVTKVYPREGRVKVTYEDSGSASAPLAMLTMNGEYSMPDVGDRVVTLYMDNGTSKGFVLGTYYGGGMQPKAGAGYRKDFDGGAYAVCDTGSYTLSGENIRMRSSSSVTVEAAEDVMLKCGYGSATAEELMRRLERIEDTLGLPHTV